MKPLQLPPTIRTPELHEVPKRPEVIKRISERQKARIVEGYILKANPSDEHPFRFFAEINIDNKNLWLLFKTLMLQLPEMVSLIYRHMDHEPASGRYMDKYELLNYLEPYKLELTQDGFLEFGTGYHDQTYMEEVFIKRPKYIQYWGMDQERFEKTMADFDIYEIEGLNFIDEFPMVTEALSLHYPAAVETTAILNQFDEKFSED